MSKTAGKAHYDFRAVCRLHDNCTVTRHGRKAGIREGTPDGKPWGFLWLFLEMGNDPSIVDRESHRSFDKWATRVARDRARGRLGLIEGSNLFFAEERAPWLGEGSEPATFVA